MLDKLNYFLVENARGLMVSGLLGSIVTLFLHFKQGISPLSLFLWGLSGLMITGSYIGLKKSKSHTIGIALVYFSSFTSGLASILLFLVGTLFLFNVLNIEG